MDEKARFCFPVFSLQKIKGYFMRSFCFFAFLLCFLTAQAQETSLYFTSQTDVSAIFIEKIRSEQKSIRLVSHRLSEVKVIEALIDAHQRAVSVEVIVDSVSVTKKTPLKLLVKEGVPVFVWNSEGFPKKKSEAPRRMHHGFCVFGSDLCWTGSYSFSLKSRFHHFENALLLQDEKISKGFLKEFEDIKKKHVISFSEYLRYHDLMHK